MRRVTTWLLVALVIFVWLRVEWQLEKLIRRVDGRSDAPASD